MNRRERRQQSRMVPGLSLFVAFVAFCSIIESHLPRMDTHAHEWEPHPVNPVNPVKTAVPAARFSFRAFRAFRSCALPVFHAVEVPDFWASKTSEPDRIAGFSGLTGFRSIRVIREIRSWLFRLFHTVEVPDFQPQMSQMDADGRRWNRLENRLSSFALFARNGSRSELKPLDEQKGTKATKPHGSGPFPLRCLCCLLFNNRKPFTANGHPCTRMGAPSCKSC
jgi:hypothetical protein